MMTPRVRLIFRSVSQVVGNEEIGILLLTDSAELRQIAMPCNQRLAGEFAERTDRPVMTQARLPEALWNVVRWQTHLHLEVQIDRIQDQKYVARLVNIDTMDVVPISASEGVLLSFVSRGDIPVMMAENLFLRQSTVFDPDAPGVSLPINTISDEMLDSALKKAVASENYEMASHLHQEQERRRKLNGPASAPASNEGTALDQAAAEPSKSGDLDFADDDFTDDDFSGDPDLL